MLESPPVDSTPEAPKVNGGIVVGIRKLVVVTGASSGPRAGVRTSETRSAVEGADVRNRTAL